MAPEENLGAEDSYLSDRIHNSKFITAHTLYTLFGDHVDPQFLDGKFRSELRCLLEYAQAAGKTSPEMIDSHLEALITSAIDLDMVIQSSQHDIKVEMHDPITGKLWGFPAIDDTDIMDDINARLNAAIHGRTFPVDMIREPSIRILGQMCGTAHNLTRVHQRDVCGWSRPMTVISAIWGPGDYEVGYQAPVNQVAVKADADADADTKTVAIEEEDVAAHSNVAACCQTEDARTETDTSIDEPAAQTLGDPVSPNSKANTKANTTGKRKRKSERKAKARAHVETQVEE